MHVYLKQKKTLAQRKIKNVIQKKFAHASPPIYLFSLLCRWVVGKKLGNQQSPATKAPTVVLYCVMTTLSNMSTSPSRRTAKRPLLSLAAGFAIATAAVSVMQRENAGLLHKQC